MNRRLYVGLALGLMVGCGGSASNSLAPSAAGTTFPPINSVTPASFGQFGATPAAGAAELGVCLSGFVKEGCFSGSAIGAAPLTASPATTVGAPTNLVSTGFVGSPSLTLAWSAPADGDPIVTYVIEVGSTTGASDLARFATGTSATTYSTTGVPSGLYYIRVRGTNAAGIDGPPSNEVLYSVGAIRCVPPGPPSALTLIASNGGTVALAWGQAGGQVASYVLQAGSAAGLSNIANTDLGGRMTGVIATNVGPGTYYVRIRARNICSVSDPSNEITVTMP